MKIIFPQSQHVFHLIWGKMCAILYFLDVVDGTSDVLCGCLSSHWFLTWSWGVLNRTSSSVWQVILTSVFIKSRIVDSHEDAFLYFSGKVLPLSAHSVGSFPVWPLVDWWPYMGEGAFRCSLNLTTSILAYFSNINFIAVQSIFTYGNILSHLLCCIFFLYRGVTIMFLSLLLLLKYIWKPYLPYMFVLLSQ